MVWPFLIVLNKLQMQITLYNYQYLLALAIVEAVSSIVERFAPLLNS